MVATEENGLTGAPLYYCKINILEIFEISGFDSFIPMLNTPDDLVD